MYTVDYGDRSPSWRWFSGISTVDYSYQSPRGGLSLGCIQLTIVTSPLMEVVSPVCIQLTILTRPHVEVVLWCLCS